MTVLVAVTYEKRDIVSIAKEAAIHIYGIDGVWDCDVVEINGERAGPMLYPQEFQNKTEDTYCYECKFTPGNVVNGICKDCRDAIRDNLTSQAEASFTAMPNLRANEGGKPKGVSPDSIAGWSINSAAVARMDAGFLPPKRHG